MSDHIQRMNEVVRRLAGSSPVDAADLEPDREVLTKVEAALMAETLASLEQTFIDLLRQEAHANED